MTLKFEKDIFPEMIPLHNQLNPQHLMELAFITN